MSTQVFAHFSAGLSVFVVSCVVGILYILHTATRIIFFFLKHKSDCVATWLEFFGSVLGHSERSLPLFAFPASGLFPLNFQLSIFSEWSRPPPSSLPQGHRCCSLSFCSLSGWLLLTLWDLTSPCLCREGFPGRPQPQSLYLVNFLHCSGLHLYLHVHCSLAASCPSEKGDTESW